VKDSDRADQRVVLDHRHDEQCPRPAELDACNGQRITLDIGLIRTIAGDVDGLARFDEPAQRVERTGRYGPRPRNSANAGGMPNFETIRAAPSSNRNRVPKWAAQMRVAFCRIVWNTGSNSPGEVEMTWSTSDVAVFCPSASLRAVVRHRRSAPQCSASVSRNRVRVTAPIGSLRTTVWVWISASCQVRRRCSAPFLVGWFGNSFQRILAKWRS
jgi:hypothetical protein